MLSPKNLFRWLAPSLGRLGGLIFGLALAALSEHAEPAFSLDQEDKWRVTDADVEEDQKLTVLYENWPPFVSYVDGKFGGVVAGKLEALLSQTDLKLDRKFLPARRVQRDLQMNTNSIAATYVRLLDVEGVEGVEVVGPIAPRLRFRLYGLRENRTISASAGRRKGKLNVLVISNSRIPVSLKEHKLIRWLEVPRLDLLATSLAFGRADLALLDEATFEAAAENGLFKKGQMIRSELLFEAELCVALARNTQQSIKDKIVSSYRHVIAETLRTIKPSKTQTRNLACHDCSVKKTED